MCMISGLQAAIGKEVSARGLGAVALHCKISSVSDYFVASNTSLTLIFGQNLVET